MGRGKHLTAAHRELIFRWAEEDNLSADRIWQLLCRRDPSVVSIDWLERLCKWFRTETEDDKVVSWLAGPLKRGGRTRLLNGHDDILITEILQQHNTMRLRLLRLQFAEYLGHDGAASTTTLWRSKRRMNITRKVVQRLSALANPVDQLRFLVLAEPLRAHEVKRKL
jgi:hypothetical protein